MPLRYEPLPDHAATSLRRTTLCHTITTLHRTPHRETKRGYTFTSSHSTIRHPYRYSTSPNQAAPTQTATRHHTALPNLHIAISYLSRQSRAIPRHDSTEQHRTSTAHKLTGPDRTEPKLNHTLLHVAAPIRDSTAHNSTIPKLDLTCLHITSAKQNSTPRCHCNTSLDDANTDQTGASRNMAVPTRRKTWHHSTETTRNLTQLNQDVTRHDFATPKLRVTGLCRNCPVPAHGDALPYQCAITPRAAQTRQNLALPQQHLPAPTLLYRNNT